MKLFFKNILFLIVVIFHSLSNANSNIDSLKSVLNNKQITDKELTKTYGNIAWEYSHIDLDSSIHYAELELKYAKKYNFKHQIGDALNTHGIVQRMKGDYRTALESFQQCIKIYLSMEDTTSLAAMYNNVGIIYQYLENPKKALRYHKKGLEYYSKSQDQLGIANSMANMGICYNNLKDYKNAEKYYLKTLEINEEMHDTASMVNSYVNMGSMYQRMGHLEKTINCYETALKIADPETDAYNYSSVLTDLGSIRLQQNKIEEGISYCKEAYDQATEKKWIDILKLGCDCLYRGYKLSGNSDLSMKYLEQFIIYKDSTHNQELNSDIAMKEADFEYSLRYSRDSIENAQEKKLKNAELAKADAELEKKNFQQYMMYGGLLLVLIFAAFMYNRFRVTQKQKNIIEEKEKETHLQKQIIEEKQKEIIDSINYAQRLQQAILTPESEIQKYFPEGFLYYKPKDIVAGDFYFFEVTDENIFYAAADCTGHGVPGAMMSIVCSNALSRCVKEFKLKDPGKILDKTRELVLETFEKSQNDVKDGMDISLVALAYRAKNEIESGIEITNIKWSGANNPLWYIENGIMKEISADKQPIGKSHELKPFNTQNLPLSLSNLFLFTDGYADQFGGPKGKKFKYSNLKKLLSETSGEKSKAINNKLETVFSEWKGDLEQVDDICIIGIKF
jgi:tetratricopeptide (TPR) repeat protein